MKANTLTKTIAYAYPTSSTSRFFDMELTGCYFIEATLWNIEGSGQISTSVHPQADSEGFLCENDPDLLQLFKECDGIIKEY